MIRRIFHSRLTRLMAGICTGLIISVGIAAALFQTLGYFEAARVQWLETRLQAAASQSGEAMAIATGPIEQGVEGIFVLDFISGDLTCGVMNPRTGQIGGLFKHNVVQDLGVEQGKKPKYLLVTGEFNVQTKLNNNRPASSIAYVADTASGRYVAYMLPWNSQMLNSNIAQLQPMIPIGTGSARNVQLE